MLTSGLFGYMADYALWVAVAFSLFFHARFFLRYFPKDKRPRLRLVVGNVLIFATLLGFAALFAETYLRFMSVKSDAFGLSLPAKRWFVLHTRLNSTGCRDEEWTRAKPDGTRRIAFVGDSFVFGWGVDKEEDRFSERIQARFDQKSPGGVEVLNVAKPGWDTGQQLQPIKDMIEYYGLDEVVLGYVGNDIEKILPTSDEFNPILPPECSIINTSTSALLDHLYRRIIASRAPTVVGYHDWLATGYADPEFRGLQEERLDAIIELCRERGVTFRVALPPFLSVGGTSYDQAAIHRQLRKFLEGRGVEVVDLAEALEGADARDLIVNRHDPHPNELAHELFASKIWAAFYGRKSPE